MIVIKNGNTVDGKKQNIVIPSDQEISIDASSYLILPGLIDGHVHFRTPGFPHKETWHTAAKAALFGGITTVFDMPNTSPTTITKERLLEKKKIIDEQLQECGISLRYELYLGADKNHFDEIPRCKEYAVGIKIFMGSSTGDLLMDDVHSLEIAFKLAAEHHMVVAVHAEDEEMIHQRHQLYSPNSYHFHSIIRNEEVAASAIQLALSLAKKYNTTLYILHVSTEEELNLIAKGKKEGINVFAETTPHHLFLSTSAYDTMQGKALVNPPLRHERHHEALWNGIKTGIIDTIGSDHAPHLLSEKNLPYGKAPSGFPGVQTTLPLMLTAYHQGLISLKKIVDLMHTNIRSLFDLPVNNDIVLVDLELEKTVVKEQLFSRPQWSPYEGMTLKGWPLHTIMKGKHYDLTELVQRSYANL